MRRDNLIVLLIGELHRRSVWQVLGTYAVLAWVIIQLAELLKGLVGLPLWFGPATVVIVLLGFPVVLITTLVQGGWKGREGFGGDFLDSAEGGDPSLSSWRRLERRHVRDVLWSLFTWRNAFLGGIAMATLLTLWTAGYSGLRVLSFGPLASLVAKGVFESNENLILAEFEDHTGSVGLGETVTALLHVGLDRSTTVRLLDRSELAQPMARMERDPADPMTYALAMELAQRVGAKAVVSGEVRPLGQGALISARLVAAGSGETLVAMRETAQTIEDVPEAVDRLSAQLRERIGEPLRRIQSEAPLEDVTTASLEALRKYAQADEALDLGDSAAAEDLVREAIALDSTFVMAYRKLGVILSNDPHAETEVQAALTRAFAGRDRLSNRERLLTEGAYHTYVTEQVPSAIAAYEAVLALYPTDYTAMDNLAALYGETDQEEKAVSLYVNAVERGYAAAAVYAKAVSALFSIGEADSAVVILDRFREAYPEHPQVLQYRAAEAAARFDFETADRFARELLARQYVSPRWVMWAEGELASYALVRGKVNEGVERILRAYGHQDTARTRFTEMARPVLQAVEMASVQLHLLEDPEGATQVLDRALEVMDSESMEPEARGHLNMAVLYAEAGRPERARERVDAFEAEVPEELQADASWRARHLFAEAAIAGARGDGGTALALYREGKTLMPECEICGLVELGEIFEAAAMPDSSVLAYERYLDTPTLFRSRTDNVRLHRALLGLARSYQALGRPGRAEEYYRRQMDLWSDADPGLLPRVRRVRGELDALRGDTL